MPPLSYVIAAIVLAVLVAASLPVTLGFSIILWYWLFAAAACVLAVAGVWRITRALHAPLWVAIALASPGLVWAANHLYELTSHLHPAAFTAFNLAAYLALLAAAAGALRLSEIVSGPHTVFRVGYGILAVAALVASLNILAYAMGWGFTSNAVYRMSARVVVVTASLVKYGAIIAAAELITLRRNVERWAGSVIGLIGIYMLYTVLRSLFVVDRLGYGDGPMFWLQPVMMLIGGAAVWRMGSVLHTRLTPPPLEPGRPPNAGAANIESLDVSDETPASDRPHARPLMSRGVAIYFGVLCALTFIALIPDAITIGTLLFLVPGLILIASSTLLYYSIAALPAYFVYRFLQNKGLAAAVAAVCLAAAALLPHYIGGYLLKRVVASDHSDPPASFQPRSFELPFPEGATLWTDSQPPNKRRRGSATPCADLCQQLLFKGNADQVVIRDSSDPLSDGTMVITKMQAYRINRDGSVQTIPPVKNAPKQTEFFRRKMTRFRLEQRETCPDTLSRIEGQFVHDAVGGRCLIEDTIDNPDDDVVLSIAKSPDENDNGIHNREADPGPSFEVRSIKIGPATVILAERRGEQLVPAEVKTTLEARYARLPFYFDVSRCGGAEIPNLCLAAASDPFPSSSADPFEMIARRYGLPIAPTVVKDRFIVPVSDDDRSAVIAILNRDYSADGYIPTTPSRFVASFVEARLKSGQLSEEDLDLIRALLKQHAFKASIGSKLPPATYQALKPLLPDMFERIADRADGQREMVQSLNVMLDQFSAEDTDSYSAGLCGEGKNADLRVCYKREFRNKRKK